MAVEEKLALVTQKSASFQRLAETLESRIMMLESALGKAPTQEVAKVLAKFPDLPAGTHISVCITEVNKKSIALKNLAQKMERRIASMEACLLRPDRAIAKATSSEPESQKAALGTFIEKLAGVCSAEKKTRHIEKPSVNVDQKTRHIEKPTVNVDQVLKVEKAQAEAILLEHKQAHEAALLEHKQAHERQLSEHKEAHAREINQHVTEIGKLRDELIRFSAIQVQEQEVHTSHAASVSGYEAQLKERDALHQQVVSDLQAQISAKEQEAQLAAALKKEIQFHQQRALEKEEGYKGLSNEHARLQQTLQDHQSKISAQSSQFDEEKKRYSEQIEHLKARMADMELQQASSLSATVTTRGPEQDLSATLSSVGSSPVKMAPHAISAPRFTVQIPQAMDFSSPPRAFSPQRPMSPPTSGSRAFSPQRSVGHPMSGSLRAIPSTQKITGDLLAREMLQVISPRYVVQSPRAPSPPPLMGMGSVTLSLNGSMSSLTGPPVVETVVAAPVHVSEKVSPRRVIQIPAIVPSASVPELTSPVPPLIGVMSPRSPTQVLSVTGSTASLPPAGVTAYAPPVVSTPQRSGSPAAALVTEMVSPFVKSGGGATSQGLAMSGGKGGQAQAYPVPMRRSLVHTQRSPRPSITAHSPRRPLFSSVGGMSPSRPSVTSSSPVLANLPRQGSPLIAVATGMSGAGSPLEGYKYGASPAATVSNMPTTFVGPPADLQQTTFTPSPREISRSSAVTETVVGSPVQSPNISRTRLQQDSPMRSSVHQHMAGDTPVRSSVHQDLARTAESLTIFSQPTSLSV